MSVFPNEKQDEYDISLSVTCHVPVPVVILLYMMSTRSSNVYMLVSILQYLPSANSLVYELGHSDDLFFF